MPLSWEFKPYSIYSLADAHWMVVEAKSESVIPTLFDARFRLLRRERFNCKLRAAESYLLVSDRRMAVISQQQLEQHFDLIEIYPKLVSDRMTARMRGTIGSYLGL